MERCTFQRVCSYKRQINQLIIKRTILRGGESVAVAAAFSLFLRLTKEERDNKSVTGGHTHTHSHSPPSGLCVCVWTADWSTGAFMKCVAPLYRRQWAHCFSSSSTERRGLLRWETKVFLSISSLQRPLKRLFLLFLLLLLSSKGGVISIKIKRVHHNRFCSPSPLQHRPKRNTQLHDLFFLLSFLKQKWAGVKLSSAVRWMASKYTTKR